MLQSPKSVRSAVARTVVLVLSLAVAFPPRAGAWGPQGHRVIARVASERLTPAARSAIKELLHADDTLLDIADWADHEGHEVFPRSAPWHYVNIAISDPHYADGRDSKRSDNVVRQIDHFRKILADRSQPKADRQTALLFLVHFVSDVHQPLHVGDNRDRGGNLTQVRFFEDGTNLHQLWDSGLIRRIGGNDQIWAGRVERAITPQTEQAWSRGTPESWADESLQAAKLAYKDLKGEPRSVESGISLGESYVKQVEPILIDQMARAAVRLAEELNAVFESPSKESRQPVAKPVRRPATAPR